MKQWYALRSKPRREASVAALLSRAAIEVYVPQVTRPARLGRPSVAEPFFPGYLFGRLDPLEGEIQMARYTHGVLYIIGYGEQPCSVPDDLILSIKDRMAAFQARKTLSEFRAGDRVAVTGGPLKDVEAIFDSHLSATGRVRVLIQILQRVCRADVHVEQLRLLQKAAGFAQA